MALSNEDKQDVKIHLGKALANRVAKVTRDKTIANIKKAGSEYSAKHSLYSKEGFKRNKEINAKTKALSNKLDKESRHIYRKSNTGAKQGNWMKVMPGDR